MIDLPLRATPDALSQQIGQIINVVAYRRLPVEVLALAAQVIVEERNQIRFTLFIEVKAVLVAGKKSFLKSVFQTFQYQQLIHPGSERLDQIVA